MIENLKFFLHTDWQNSKKYSLPKIIDFDQKSSSVENILDQLKNYKNYWIERNRILRYL